MALAPQLIHWIAANTSKLDMRATELTWPRAWMPGFSAIKLSLKVGDARHDGIGFDRCPDTAVGKAVVEAIERAVKRKHQLPTTSGLAGHSEFSEACQKARLELIERDAFFCHALTGTPFLDITAELSNYPITQQMREQGVEIRLLSMTMPSEVHGIVAVAFGHSCERPFGSIVGLGCGPKREEAVEHALFECLFNVAAYREGKTPAPLSTNAFKRIENPGPSGHFAWALHPDHSGAMTRLIGQEKLGVPLRNGFVSDIMALDLPAEVEDAPLVFARAISSETQLAYFGHLTEAHINMKRLTEFCGRSVIGVDELYHPHPLG